MSHTSGITLLIGAVIGGVLGWAGQWLLVASGNPALLPPATWGVALAAVGAILLALAWPIRTQVRSEKTKPPVDPFYATRVVLLAKAGAVAGSALSGVGGGVAVFFASRPVVLSETLIPAIVAIVGALVLMVGALIAERWCTLPPDSPEGGANMVPEGELS
ncbi:MAG: DUF3180 domain-containing protein [Pontimonas sp.]|nr:DUF3180 domain-containing protein [Pontimonas sp.]